MDYTVTYTQTPAEKLEAEFVIVYGTHRDKIHAATCPNRRLRGSHEVRTTLNPEALRNTGQDTLAPCCTDHAARLDHLARQAG